MMKTALISDIHGNLKGLKEVLRDIENCGCDRIICLGDLVDGGNENEGVVQQIMEKRIPCVRGNHDEFNDLRLATKTKEFLNQLPEEIIENEVIYTHISPRNRKRKVRDGIEAWNIFDETNYKISFIGHVHIPLLFGEKSNEFGNSTQYFFDYNKPVYLDHNDRYIICVGAVGYGRDLVGKIRYAIFDDEKYMIEYRAIEGHLLPIDWTLVTAL